MSCRQSLSSAYDRWCSWSGGPVEYASSTYCTYLEVFHYPLCEGVRSSQCVEGCLDDESLPRWLENDPTVQGSNGGKIKPVGGFRLLIGVLDCSTGQVPVLPMSKASYETFQKHAPIPREYFDQKKTSTETRAFIFSPKVSGQDAKDISGFGFQFPCDHSKEQYNSYVLLLNHNKLTNITFGFLQVKRSIDHVAPILHLLIDNINMRDEAAFLPLLFIESQLQVRNKRLCESDDKLNELEEQMDQHETPLRPRGDLMAIDFATTMRRINDITKLVALDRAYVSCLMLGLETLLTWKDECFLHSCESDVGNRIAFAKDTCKLIFTKVDYEEKRAQMLIQVVYQSMAQKDAKINIALLEYSALIAKAGKEDSAIMKQIAIETKKDNASMKTIAILGMVFLPGTFVATIFTMPVFDSNLSIRLENRGGFGNYWIVTIPLTAMVLVMWVMATLVPWKKYAPKMFSKKAAGLEKIC